MDATFPEACVEMCSLYRQHVRGERKLQGNFGLHKMGEISLFIPVKTSDLNLNNSLLQTSSYSESRENLKLLEDDGHQIFESNLVHWYLSACLRVSCWHKFVLCT